MSEYEVTVRLRVETTAQDGLLRLVSSLAERVADTLASTEGVASVGRLRADVTWVDAPYEDDGR